MDETLTQIEKYLSGQLKQEEMDAFENRLKTDPELAAELALYKDMMGGLRLRNNKQLKNRLNEIHEQEIDAPPKEATVRPMRWKFAVAVAAACILVLFSIVFLRNNNPSPKALYASNFKPFEVDWNTRSAAADELPIDQVKALYESQQYQELSQLFQVDSLAGKFVDVKFTMVKGISSLEQNRYQEARGFFQQASSNSLIKAEAQWYTALSYLKEENIEACKNILKQLASDDASDYAEEAAALLKDL